MITRDPHVWGKAAIGVVRRIAHRCGVEARWTIHRPAHYAVTTPCTKAAQLFVTAHARSKADIVIADYMFLARAFPYAARPDGAPDFSAAIMPLTICDETRAALAVRLVDAARVHFSPDACYESLRGWLAGSCSGPAPHSNEEARLCA